MMQLLDAVGALCNLADKPDALARLIQDPTCVDSGGEAIHWEKANTQACMRIFWKLVVKTLSKRLLHEFIPASHAGPPTFS